MIVMVMGDGEFTDEPICMYLFSVAVGAEEHGRVESGRVESAGGCVLAKRWLCGIPVKPVRMVPASGLSAFRWT